ncbi:ribonuclease H-like domain-containing protein [Tanacetum coccineum]
MKKYILKQQFEGFSVSNSEGFHKGYDRFQSLLSQLEIHGAGVSTEDANQKFLRSLPSSWSQVSLIMRTKLGVDSLNFDDLYNNLRVFETCVKGSIGSSSSALNVAFVSSESTSSTNDISTAYEMDLKWQVAMISMILKKFYKKAGRKLQFDAKEPVGFNKTKVECLNCDKTGHFARECKSKGNQDIRRRDAGNTGYKAKDNGRRHDKTDVLTYHKKLLAEAVTEKEELITKLEKWQNSSKSLNKLLDSQMSVKEKIGLDAPAYDRFAKVEGMHAVPPQMTGNYMPLKSNFGIDESQFAYGPKQSKTSESDAKTSDFDFCESNSSVETLESVPELVVIEPKIVSQPKVWSDAPIIEEYESDSDDKYVIKSSKEHETPSFAFVNVRNYI